MPRYIQVTQPRSNMTNQPPSEALPALENAIKDAGLDLYVVPMVDEFQGEYIPAYAARLPQVTGFTGSAGMGVFWAKPHGAQRHALFVDGRYTLQAANEVNTDAVQVLNSGEVSFTDWLAGFSDNPLRVGFDSWLVTIQQLHRWQQKLPQVVWVPHRPNLVDQIWKNQPSAPQGNASVHPITFTGATYADKRGALLETIIQHQADGLLLTQPDAINWLLNIRGDDIPFNPLLLSYLLLKNDGNAVLYTYPHTWSEELTAYFREQNVTLAELSELFGGTLRAMNKGARIIIDPATTPYGLAQLAEQAGLEVIEAEDPTQLPKARKNHAELAGIRDAHLRDGLALVRFFHWFDQQIENKKLFDELEVVSTLESFRRMDDTYRGPSFATIAGAGPHGAIIHYRADEKSNRRARKGELFLLDSGGQYPGGTTDVTRTMTIGAATTVMKEHFTRVLKGHIGLASAVFPRGTSGIQLDILARQHLWAAGLDFDHGTGHGVGAYLCVHEGPQRISKRGSLVPLEVGMILSNEPGYYAEGQYGIRIENLVAVVPGKGNMLAFETLTLAPIDIHLIEVGMLTADERNWINSYHQRVYQAHEAKLEYDQRRWLERATRAI